MNNRPKSIIKLILCLMTSVSIYGQNTEDKWAVSISGHSINHYATIQENFKGFADEKYNDLVNPGISIYRKLGKRWMGDLSLLTGNITNYLYDLPKDEPFYTAELGISFRPLRNVRLIDPFIRLGLGYHHYDYNNKEIALNSANEPVIASKDFFQGSAGIGINFWIFNKVGFQIASKYDYMPFLKGNEKDFNGYIDYFSTSFGIIARFGGSYKAKTGIMPLEVPVQINDKDKDGVPDETDACPEVAGFEYFQGCPDTDKDGIAENIDQCPTEHGPLSNNGCPIPPTVDEIKEAFKWVNFVFEVNTANLTTQSKENAKVFAEIIRKSKQRFYIDGYADSTGPAEKNRILSLERAKAIVSLLIENGIPKDQLEARGFGETKPIESNKIKEGRERNRRVELSPIENENLEK